jgi:hypothetical protein
LVSMSGTTPTYTAPGTGVLTFLATPSSANLASAVTDETGSGALVFGTSPDFTTGATIGSVAIPTISSTSTLTNKTIAAGSNTITGLTNSNLSGTAGITAANLSYTSQSLLANNTGSTAAPSAITYQEVTETTYAGTATWDGTAPSGSTGHTYRWSQIGKTVTLWINLFYQTPGITNTTVSMTFPSGVPLPATVTSFTGANASIIPASASLGTTLAGTTGGVVRGYYGRDASDNPALIILAATAIGAKVARIAITYQTN